MGAEGKEAGLSQHQCREGGGMVMLLPTGKIRVTTDNMISP